MLPFDLGMGREARLVRLKKFFGEALAGPAEAVAARAKIEAAIEAFILIVGWEVERLGCGEMKVGRCRKLILVD